MADDQNPVSDFVAANAAGSQASASLFDTTDNISTFADAPAEDSAGGSMPSGLFSSTGAWGSFVGGLGDLAQSATDFMSAGAYREAAKAYDTASAETGWMQAVPNYQISTRTSAVLGTEQAQEGAAGLTGGGSNQYLAKETQMQGGLALGTSQEQAELKEQGYEFQAKEANQEAESSTLGGILGAVLGVVGIAGGVGII